MGNDKIGEVTEPNMVEKQNRNAARTLAEFEPKYRKTGWIEIRVEKGTRQSKLGGTLNVTEHEFHVLWIMWRSEEDGTAPE